MSLEDLTHSIEQLAERFAGTAGEVARAAEGLRGSTAGILESAIAGAAAAAAAMRIELALAVAPRLPGATGPGVCEEIVALEQELTELLPQGVAAAVFAGDPRGLPALFALLARDDDIAAVLDEAAASSNSLLNLAQSFGTALGQASAQGPAQATMLLRQVAEGNPALDLAPAALRVLTGSVQRVQASAQRGARAVFDHALSLAQKLQAGQLARVFPGRQGSAISLDREYNGVVPGSYVLLDRQDYRELYRVQAVGQGSRAEFAVQGKSSWLTLAGANLGTYADKVRETTVHLRSERLARARAPLGTTVSGSTVQVAADVTGMAAGRRVLVRGQRVDNGQTLVHAATVVSATLAAQAADGGTLVIDPPLPAALKRSSVVVFGNVALASHGETVAQVLGSGDAAQAHQRFELKHAPLTHRAAATESGARSELTVRVGDVQWQQRASLFGASPTDRAFTLQTDEQDRVWVRFGDGQHGARLPGAANNLRVSYRKGLGAAGNVRAEALSQAMSRPLGFKGVSNPAAASGGTDPEDPATARRSIPLGARTLGRAVSVLDYEDFARAFAGIAKAEARVLRLRQGPVVAITVAGTDNVHLAEDNPVRSNLLAALKASGDPHVQVRLLAHRSRSFRLGLKVRCADDREPAQVLASVEAALRARYAFDERALGQPVHASEVVAVAHGVPGVVAIDLDFLYLTGTVSGLKPALVAGITRVSNDSPAAAEVLTLDAAPFDRLEAMA